MAVGDFASVYADGATVTGFIGRVTARDATTITISGSFKSGTAPTDGTNDRTLKIGGAWLGPNGAEVFPFSLVTDMLVNVAGNPIRFNMKNDAQYDITAAITMGAGGSGNGSMTMQGYTTVYGDLGRATIDGGISGASYVLFSGHANAQIYVADMIFANNGETGTAAGILAIRNSLFERCVVHDVRGIGFDLDGSRAVECEAYNCNQSNTAAFGGFRSAFSTAGEANQSLLRCIAHHNSGSNNNGFVVSGNITDCIADSNGLHGFRVGNTINLLSLLKNNDAYNNGGSGMHLVNITGFVYVENCNLVRNGAYGINAVALSNAGGFFSRNNGFGAGTMANTSGAINAPAAPGVNVQAGTVMYGNDLTPWVDPDNGDFRINLAAAINAGRGSFTQTQVGYAGAIGFVDIGAVQHADPAAQAEGADYLLGI